MSANGETLPESTSESTSGVTDTGKGKGKAVEQPERTMEEDDDSEEESAAEEVLSKVYSLLWSANANNF